MCKCGEKIKENYIKEKSKKKIIIIITKRIVCNINKERQHQQHRYW